MKLHIAIYILLIALSSCGVQSHIQKGELTKTRVYVGKFISSTTSDNLTQVQTTDITVTIKGEIYIPKGELCYIRIDPCLYDMHPDIRWQMERQWLEFGDESIRIKNNIRL